MKQKSSEALLGKFNFPSFLFYIYFCLLLYYRCFIPYYLSLLHIAFSFYVCSFLLLKRSIIFWIIFSNVTLNNKRLHNFLVSLLETFLVVGSVCKTRIHATYIFLPLFVQNAFLCRTLKANNRWLNVPCFPIKITRPDRFYFEIGFDSPWIFRFGRQAPRVV